MCRKETIQTKIERKYCSDIGRLTGKMNSSRSQTTLSDRHKLSQSLSSSSLPAPFRVYDSSVESLTGKGQLFQSFQSYGSQDSVLSNDRLQPSDVDSVDAFDTDVSSNVLSLDSREQNGKGPASSKADEKDSFHLNMTVKELLDTEQIYVKDLHDIVFVCIFFKEIIFLSICIIIIIYDLIAHGVIHRR